MGRFSDYLRELNPINGRWLAEDGEFVNVADWLKTQRDTSAAWHTCQGRARRVSTVVRNINVADYYIGIRVPAGKIVVLDEIGISLTSNIYEVRIINCPSGFTGGTQMVHSDLNQLIVSGGQALCYYGITPNLTGASTLFETLQSVATGQAQNITNSVLASQEITTVLNTDRIVHIKRDATPGDIFSMAVQLVIWEFDT